MPLALINLQVGYQKKALFQPFTATFDQPSCIALLGANGTGKSTFLSTLLRIQKPLAGQILLDQQPLGAYSLKALAQKIAFVLPIKQFLSPHLLAHQVVGLGRLVHQPLLPKITQADQQIILQAFELVGATHLMNVPFFQLSDGQKQLIMIARGLAQQTPYVILDEPTAYLDTQNSYLIVNLLVQIAEKERKCIIFSTHDHHVIQKKVNQIIRIQDQKIDYQDFIPDFQPDPNLKFATSRLDNSLTVLLETMLQTAVRTRNSFSLHIKGLIFECIFEQEEPYFKLNHVVLDTFEDVKLLLDDYLLKNNA